MFYVGRSELRIMVDPVCLHTDGSYELIENQVLLTTIMHYLPAIGENKVDIKIYFPEYLWDESWGERYLSYLPGEHYMGGRQDKCSVTIIKVKGEVKEDWKIQKIRAVRSILEQKKDDNLKIEKFDTSKPEDIKRFMESIKDGTLIRYRDADYLYNHKLIDIVDEYFQNNCDLLLTSNKIFLGEANGIKKQGLFAVNYPEIFGEVETFLKGNNIYISHNNPIYGLDASVFSPMVDIRWQKYHRLWEHMNNQKKVDDVNEYFRAVLFHRYSFLMYSVDQIKFQIFQADRMDEQKLRLNHYFLASYHLNSVYLNLWAFLDNLAWIFNYYFTLGFDRRSSMKVTFTSKDYKKKLQAINLDLYEIIFKQKNIEWFDELSIKRHPAAHREPLFFSQLFNQKDMSSMSERMIVVGTKDGRAFFDAISNMESDIEKLFALFDDVCTYFSIV